MMGFPLTLPIDGMVQCAPGSAGYKPRKITVIRHPDGRMTAEVALLTPQEFTAMSAFADGQQVAVPVQTTPNQR